MLERDISSIEVDSGLVTGAAINIDGYINEMQTISEVFDTDFVPGLTPYWQGKAKNKFEHKFKSFSIDFKSLVSDYMNLNEQLENAGMDYDKGEETVKQIISRMQK